MRRRPEISEKFVLADLRRLPEHPVGLGRILGLERDRQICRSNEESGSVGPSIKEKAGSTGRPNARWAGGLFQALASPGGWCLSTLHLTPVPYSANGSSDRA